MSDLRTVNIVRLSMSGGLQTTEREEVNGTQIHLTMKFDKPTRDKIAGVRNKFRARALKGIMNFVGLQVAREDQLSGIRVAIDEADVELKAIDPGLSARVAFVPISADAQARGEMFAMLSNSIHSFVLGELFQRLKELPIKDGKIPTRSRIAVLELADRLSAWNVFGDPDLAKFIAEAKFQLENNIVAPVVVDLEKQLESLKSEGAFVEL